MLPPKGDFMGIRRVGSNQKVTPVVASALLRVRCTWCIPLAEALHSNRQWCRVSHPSEQNGHASLSSSCPCCRGSCK